MINFKMILDSILSPKLVFQKVLNYEIKPSILIEAVLFISIINALFTYTSNYLIYSNANNLALSSKIYRVELIKIGAVEKLLEKFFSSINFPSL